MKTCTYCGQESPEEATRCVHCGTEFASSQDQPTDAPAPMSPPEPEATPPAPTGSAAGGWGWPSPPRDDEPPASTEPPPPSEPPPAAEPPPAETSTPARVGEGALRFSHSGETYILGYGADFFGVWDRNQPGGPILQFPRTDQGWNEAWNRFSGMERRFVEVPHVGTPPDVRVSSASAFKPLRTVGGWLVALLAAAAVLSAITMVLRGVEITRFQDFRSGLTSLQSVDDARQAANGVGFFAIVAILASAVVWLIWHHRAQANLRKLGVDGQRFTPGWVIAWWIIPFANFVMPPQVTAETWRASEPATGAIEWKRKRISPVFVIWWSAWLARIPFTSLASAAAPQSGGSIEQLIRQRSFAIAADAATVVAGLAAIMIVRQITRWQHEKRDRVAAYGQAAAAAAP